MGETTGEWINRLTVQWWERLSPENREALAAASAKSELDESTVRLLIESSCPIGPVGAQWEGQDYTWSWPVQVRELVQERSH